MFNVTLHGSLLMMIRDSVFYGLENYTCCSAKTIQLYPDAHIS
jgi:hypothetical protein